MDVVGYRPTFGTWDVAGLHAITYAHEGHSLVGGSGKKVGVSQISWRCSIPCFETFASVIVPGIQSGLSLGASSCQAHPS